MASDDTTQILRANLECQNDELEALQAIYGEDFSWAEEMTEQRKSFFMAVPGDFCVILLVHLPALYPSHEPPAAEVYESFGVPTLERTQIISDLRCSGQVCLYEWIESIREKYGVYASYEAESLPVYTEEDALPAVKKPSSPALSSFQASIFVGNTITDRKSIFQVNEFITHLVQDRKIRRATHNILAYRIVHGSIVIKNSDDDGEDGAGSKLLHLLEMTRASNVAVVVTRWYGGIKLGPDRFKHIKNAARDVLERHGLISKKK